VSTRQEERFDGWTWPDWDFDPAADPEERTPVQTRRDKIASVAWPAVFLFYLAQPVSEVFSQHKPSWEVATVLALVVGYAVSYLYVCVRGQASSHLVRGLMVAWLCLFPIALAVLLGTEMLIFFTYAVSVALMMIPAFVGAALGFGSAISLIVGTWIQTGTADFGTAMILVVLTLAMFALGGLIRTVRKLRATEGKMARLAVAEERSRLARDLHDVLGHSLTTITVKAGLARRVLESSADRDRAVEEVRDVENLARQAMTDVRATVSGYRTASLPAELVGARAALSAAGIAADLPRAVDNVTADLQETFAYVLREGVTNVIRHSGASRCEVRLGDSWLEIRDNGRSAAEQVRVSRATGGGHGLSGLAERVAAVDGTLEAGPLPAGGFLLRVSVPSSGQGTPPGDGRPVPDLACRPAVGLA
jgi:two-component system, NarL family, sensor histidine kinase DesK